MITRKVVAEAQNWHNKYKKPVIMAEYGADTMIGLHEVTFIFLIYIYFNFKLRYSID